jgi:RNA polymerase sigma-70 factor (ECF subfamily)
MGPRIEVEVLLAERSVLERLAAGLVRDSSLAEDLAQEAWLAAARSGPRTSGSLRAFLAGVLRNLRRNQVRAERRRARREAAAARPEALPSSAELVERAELQRLLVESVLALPDGERTAVLLRYFEDLTAEEIARRAGVPSATIRSRIRRGLERVRVRLESRVPRRDLFAGLVGLARWPGSPAGTLAAGPVLTSIGGILAMKTFAALVAGCAVLALLLATGKWLMEEPVRETREPTRSSSSVETAEPLVSALDPGTPSELHPAKREALAAAPLAAPAPGAAPIPAPRLEARVVDAHGIAVASALVLETRGRTQTTLGESDAAGSVALELAQVERETMVTLEFRHPRFARRELEVVLTPGAAIQLGEVALVPAGSIQGWVEDASGRRPAKARVIVAGLENERTDPEELRRQGPLLDRSTIPSPCAADGSFSIDGVPAGPVRVWAGADGHAWSSVGPLEIVAGETLRTVRLVLAPLRAEDRISGFVLDPEGNPVANARVQFWFTAASYGTGGAEETDAEGHFEILLQQRVAHDLTISDEGNRWSEIWAPQIEPGTEDIELVFEPPRWIDVSVRNGEGAPLEGFELRLESALGNRWLDMRAHWEPPVEGRTRLRVPSARFRVSASAHGHELASQGPFDPLNPPASLAFELAALPGIRGRVLTAGGEPAAGARLALAWALSGKIGMVRDGFRLVVDPYPEVQATADAAGAFVLYPPATDGMLLELVLTAEAPGHALTALEPRAYDPHEGVELEIRLVKGGAIEGRARAPAGFDPTGFVLAYQRGDGKIHTLRLGPDGHYRIDRLTPGPWEVRPLGRDLEALRQITSNTIHEDGAPPMDDWNVRVVDGETTHLDVDLSGFAPCSVRGRLELEGRELAGWTASLELEPSFSTRTVLAAQPLFADGRFELQAEQASRYQLVLRGPEDPSGRLELSEEVELAPGALDWTLRLRPGRIEGSGARAEGARDRYYSYEWSGTEGGHALTGTVRILPDADGRFVLPSVPPGAARIRRNDPPPEGQRSGEWVTVTEFVVEPGGLRTIVLPGS